MYVVGVTRSAQTSDRIRQVVVLVLSLLTIAAAFFGSGALGGTTIQDAAGGALAEDSTLIAPASPAFSIWSVIYLGLLAHAIWQLFPRQAARAVQRRVGYLIALSMLLNAVWIGVVQLDQVGLSVLVIIVLLAVLGLIFSILQRTPSDAGSKTGGIVESIILHGTTGLYLGWVTIATAANVAAWLADIGFRGFGIAPDAWGITIVAVAAVCGIATAIAGHGRLAPALALAWGLCWVAVGRLTGEPESQAVGITAAVAACVVIVVAIMRSILVQRAGTVRFREHPHAAS